MGGCKVRITMRYSCGITNMRNAYGTNWHSAQEQYEAMRNAYEPQPERRIVLPGEVYRYVDEDESDAG